MEQTTFYLSVLGILLPVAVIVAKAALNVSRAANDVGKVLKEYPPHAHTPDGFILYPEGYEPPTFKTFEPPKKAQGVSSGQ